MVLEKTLESPLDCKEFNPVHPKDQSWVFIGRTDVEAETPILWPPDEKSRLIGKDPGANDPDGKTSNIPMSQLFGLGGQSIGAPASASVLPMNIQD